MQKPFATPQKYCKVGGRGLRENLSPKFYSNKICRLFTAKGGRMLT